MARRDKGDSGRKWAVFGSAFIALLFITSIFGVMIGSYSNEIKYGKYKFTQTENGYTTNINGQAMNFYTLPPETAYLNFSNASKAKLFQSPFIVTTFNPNTANTSIAAIEVARFDLANAIGAMKVYNVVSEYSEQYASVPIVTCENATVGAPVIVFNVSDRLGVVDTGSCVYFNGRDLDFLRIRDLLLYSYYGVI
jgi:hypothetical protein